MSEWNIYRVRELTGLYTLLGDERCQDIADKLNVEWRNSRAALAERVDEPPVRVSVDRMGEAHRVTYWVQLHRGDETQSIRQYPEHYKNRADYEADSLRFLFGQGPQPDLADDKYNDQTAVHPVEPAAPPDERRIERAWLRTTDKYVISKKAAFYFANELLATPPSASTPSPDHQGHDTERSDEEASRSRSGDRE